MTPDTPAATLERASPYGGAPAFPTTARVKLVPAGVLTRFNFRGPRAAADAAGAAFGTPLAPDACRATSKDGRAALWLGPDEWLLIARDGEAETLFDALEAAVSEPHSLVDVSHRNSGFVISGPRAADTLAAGNPLDLDAKAFPVGMCTRTLVGKAEVVLWRQASDRFHIDCWRSFAPYIQAYLGEAAREYLAG